MASLQFACTIILKVHEHNFDQRKGLKFFKGLIFYHLVVTWPMIAEQHNGEQKMLTHYLMTGYFCT
jgi:hypothetical protein